MKNKTIVHLIAGLFILLFVYTAISKLFTVHSFQKVLAASPLLSNHAPLFTWSLPLVELVVAILLYNASTVRLGLYLSLALMTAFTIYIAYMLAYTPKLPCSCGGVLKFMTWEQHLVFNIFFILLAIIGIWLYRKQRSNNAELAITTNQISYS